MKILAIDTSTEYLSLAIADNGRILARFHEKEDMKHSSLLVPTIDKLLKKCGLKLKDINAIALSIGPGSFTGLRIGVATCKGINLALGIPIVAVPTLDAIAYNFIASERVLCPLIDAKKQKVYACFYKGTERLSDYMLLDMEGLLKKIDKPTLVFGSAIKIYGERCKENRLVRISTKDWHPKAEIVAKLGLAKALRRQFANPYKLAPLYLHSKYCQVKKI
ncbi:MAG: tRNA (adenosine(37)-N6)-threonylcarbamoyltransferase complex dimerization subunit type 1 TsaB [Candidatus Omnitrophota bacterium]|nr:MAG: tRNA (adenosine(37)-N6)-threonylcarbamoyltransferase complex dimerization subunit type 1 TsaB [Candidatus Omnitrophota bacterium]